MYQTSQKICNETYLGSLSHLARRAGSDGSMSASGSAGPGFDPRRG